MMLLKTPDCDDYDDNDDNDDSIVMVIYCHLTVIEGNEYNLLFWSGVCDEEEDNNRITSLQEQWYNDDENDDLS